MKKIIKILILLILTLTSCQGQEKKNKGMEILYSNKTNKFELRLEYKNSNSKNYWYLKAINSKNDTLLLDSFELNDEPKNAVFHKYGDIRKQMMVGDYTLENDIFYIVLYKNSNVFLQESKINGNNVDKKEYKIGEDKRGSYENFGDPTFKAEIKNIDNQFFISSQYCPLIKFQKQTKELNKIIFFDTTTSNYIDSFAAKNDFKYNEKFIKTVILPNNLKPIFSEYIKNPKSSTENHLSIFRKLKYSEKYSYSLFQIEDLNMDNANLRNEEISDFMLFSNIDIKDNEQVKNAISYVLDSYNSSTNKFIKDYLGYLKENRKEEVFCFFYKDVSDKINIVRYNKDNSYWMLGNYKEEKLFQKN